MKFSSLVRAFVTHSGVAPGVVERNSRPLLARVSPGVDGPGTVKASTQEGLTGPTPPFRFRPVLSSFLLSTKVFRGPTHPHPPEIPGRRSDLPFFRFTTGPFNQRFGTSALDRTRKVRLSLQNLSPPPSPTRHTARRPRRPRGNVYSERTT